MIASGDITSRRGAARVLDETGCAAIAIGRGGLGNPWLFDSLSTGAPLVRPDLSDAVAELRTFADDITLALGDHRAGLYLRKFYGWYLDGHGISTAAREEILTAGTVAEAFALLDGLAERPAAVSRA